VPVGDAALVDAVEQAVVLGPDGADTTVVVLIGAVEGLPGVVGIGDIGGIACSIVALLFNIVFSCGILL
jgi:hypothetical protein